MIDRKKSNQSEQRICFCDWQQNWEQKNCYRRNQSYNLIFTDCMLNQIEDNAKTGKIGIHTFTNASAHEIGQTRVKLVSIQFASSEENHMQFFAQIVVDVAADHVERSAEASGTVVLPFPGGSGSGTGF